MKEWNTDYPGTVTVSTFHQEGACAAKYSTPAGPHPNYVDNPTSRAEVQAPRQSGTAPLSFTWEQLLYIPSEANNGPYYDSVSQTKQNNAHCYAGGLSLERSDQRLYFNTVDPDACAAHTRSGKFPAGGVATPRNQWFAVKVAETFSHSGSLQVWLDPDGTGQAGYGVMVPLTTGVDTLAATGSTVELKLRQGLYHREDQHESHIFGDGFHLDCLAGC
jgi:hypothetical protein